MDAFRDMEKDSKWDYPDARLVNLHESETATTEDIQINSGKEEEDGEEEEEEDDDFDMHQSRLDAQQFELRGDPEENEVVGEIKISSAIQKIKERMKLQQLKESELRASKVIETSTQQITQVVTQTEVEDGDEEMPDITSTQQISSQTIIQSTQKLPSENSDVDSNDEDADNDSEGDDDDDDDDEFNTTLPTRKKNAIINSDDDDDEDEDDHFIDQLAQTEPIQATEETPNKQGIHDDSDDEDDDDEQIILPNRHSKKLSPKHEDTVEKDEEDDDDPIQPTTHLGSLFVSEDEDSETEMNNVVDQIDEIAARIDNYESMSAEQRYLARKIERSKIRDEKRQASVDKSRIISQKVMRDITPDLTHVSNKQLAEIRKHKVETHTILKNANREIKIIADHEYSKDKLLQQLRIESDSEDENKDSSKTLIAQSTSPDVKSSIKPVRELIKDREVIQSQTDLIEFSESDNDSNDSVELDPVADISIIEKTKKLDLNLKYSKKKKSKIEKVQKLSFTDKIQKLKAKQLKDKLSTNVIESKSSKTTYTDAELAKMLLQDQMNSSVKEKNKRKEQKKLEKQRQLLREGKLTHDDDDPEFSSDYDLSEDSEDYGSGEEDEGGEHKDEENEDAEKSTEVKHSAAGLFDTSGKFGEFNFSMSNMSEKVATQDKEFDGLTSAEKFKKMKEVIVIESQTQRNNSTTDVNDTFRSNNNISHETILSHSIMESQNFQLNDLLDSQNLVLETQADNLAASTQKLGSESTSMSTQKLDNDSGTNLVTINTTQKVTTSVSFTQPLEKPSFESTQNTQEVDEESDEEDDDEKIQTGRKKKVESSDDDEEEGEETEEQMQRRAELIKLAKKKAREDARKREAEFREKGLGDMMEKEAVESDDEYHGVGGKDRDVSDEEDSEDEKMIDDATNGDIGEDEIRKFHLDKELAEDQAKVAKTYKDVKTHELGKRRATKDGIFDVSDSEDDEMDEQRRMIDFIRKRRLKERHELMARNDYKIDANDPKKAFYDEMNVHLPSHISVYKDSFTNSVSDLENNDADDNEGNENQDIKDYYNNIESFKAPALKKRKTTAFKSFDDDDDFKYSSFHDQETDRLKAEVLSDSTDDDDHDGSKKLKQMKKKTSVKLTRKLGVPKPRAKEPTDDFGEHASFGLLTKSNSVTSSFKKSTEKKIRISANTGKEIREVTVTTTSKSITNSKAAVTGMSSSSSIDNEISKKKVVRGSGLDRLDKMLAKSRQKGIKTLGKR